MATRTSITSGAWSGSSTWDTGVPLDNDNVIIAAGHNVNFDADQSTFTTGIGIMISGSLTHTSASGTYTMFLRTGSAVFGSGTWNIGTSGSPLPFASKHLISGSAGWYIEGLSGLDINIYGTEPTNKYIRLSGAEAIGQTALSVDTNVTGDIWAEGDTIRIDDIDKGIDSEERVIAVGGISPTEITITSGLTNAKLAGALVILCTRNVKFLTVGAPTRLFYRVNALNIGSGAFFGNNRPLCTEGVINFSGGVINNSSLPFGDSNPVTITGGVITYSTNNGVYYARTTSSVDNMLFSACNIGVRKAAGNIKVTNCTFSGCTEAVQGADYVANSTINGCTNGVTTYYTNIENCTISNCTYGVVSVDSVTINGTTFTGNTNNFRYSTGVATNITITGGVEHYQYTSLTNNTYGALEILKYGGVDGAYKAWTKGGVITSQTSVKPTGYVQAYLLDPESASFPCFMKVPFVVLAGKTFTIEVQLRKDSSMTYLPRVYLMRGSLNPIFGSTAFDSFTMTNSTDTWETDTFTIDNSVGTVDLEYALWFVAQNATGNVYSAYDISVAGATSTSGISRSRVYGGL